MFFNFASQSSSPNVDRNTCSVNVSPPCLPLHHSLVSSHLPQNWLQDLTFIYLLSVHNSRFVLLCSKKIDHSQNLLLSFERSAITITRYFKAEFHIQEPTCQTTKGKLPATHFLDEPDSHQCEDEIGECCDRSQPYCKSVIFHAGHLEDGCAVVPASKEQTGCCGQSFKETVNHMERYSHLCMKKCLATLTALLQESM